MHFLELPKLVEGRVDLDKPEVTWLLYLKGVDEEVFQMIARDEPLLQISGSAGPGDLESAVAREPATSAPQRRL